MPFLLRCTLRCTFDVHLMYIKTLINKGDSALLVLFRIVIFGHNIQLSGLVGFK
jgi:hypothetical protein